MLSISVSGCGPRDSTETVQLEKLEANATAAPKLKPTMISSVQAMNGSRKLGVNKIQIIHYKIL